MNAKEANSNHNQKTSTKGQYQDVQAPWSSVNHLIGPAIRSSLRADMDGSLS